MITRFTSNSSGTGSPQPLRRRLLFGVASSAALAACGGGSDAAAPSPAPSPAPTPPPPPPPSSVWAAVDAAVDKAAPSFGNGLTVEVAIPAGVVYSRSSGGYTSQTRNPIASATKWVTGSTILRLVQQGTLTLATRTGDLLVDRNGAPWSGPIGQITLSDLLSFTSGLEGDVDEATATSITLAEAVLRIHDSQSKPGVLAPPKARYWYGATHLRVAGRMAEVATGKSWQQIFDAALRVPLGWDSTSIYSLGGPNPALDGGDGGIRCSGEEYMRFLVMLLRKGLYGGARLISENLIATQRADAFTANTVIVKSPYQKFTPDPMYHYGLCNFRECGNPGNAGACDVDPTLRFSSPGALGFGPWIDVYGNYAACVMTRQPQQGNTEPSEVLKQTLAPLIRSALTSNPAVIRPLP
ncbi:MAG: serine hydrolase domain-containing protein [Betaproteobacteria bacterium]